MTQLTTEQLRAVEARGKLVCVDAGAGSGKTRVLVQRILHLIEHDRVNLGQIAAITFTDKAAAEMKERLRRAFREKAPPDDPRKMSFWRRLEREVDMARISTIHTFCSGILRENALSLGIDPDFAVLTEAESEVLCSEVVTATMHRLLDEDDDQAHAAASEFGIRDLDSILHELLAQRVLADRLLHPGMTAQQIAAGWAVQLPQINDELIRTCLRSRKLRHQMRLLGECEGQCADPTDKREQVRLTLLGLLRQLHNERNPSVIQDIIAQIGELRATQGKIKKWTSESAYESVKLALNDVKKCLKSAAPLEIDPELESRAAEIAAAVAHVYTKTAEALRETKRERNVLDFDDLIAIAAEVLRDTSKGEDSVCARTARGLRHILIDEFQDTDSVQYEIAQLLSQSPNGPDLFIVGDAKQSIYYFRGAEVGVFRQVRRDVRAPLPMLGNFRTAPPVLRFINSFFAASDLLAMVESPFNPLDARRESEGAARIEFLIPPAKSEKTGIEMYRNEEARMIAASLGAIAEGGIHVMDSATNQLRPARFGDAAILLRSLSNVHLYERALREAGVPYTLIAGHGFYERQEVIDFRNLLALLVDPCDELALAAFLRGPIVGLSDNALVELAGGIGAPRGVLHGFATDTSLSDATQFARLIYARDLIRKLRCERDRPLTEFVQLAFTQIGLEGVLLRQFMGRQRVGNLRKIAALAETFSGAHPPSLRAFVRYLDDMAAREIREGEAAPNVDDQHSVTVMTIHKAKGLEFPIVYVADLGREPKGGRTKTVALHKDIGFAARVIGPEGTFAAPAIHNGICRIRSDEEMAEEARLLYVAMTRARDHMFLCGKPEDAGGKSWMAAFDEQYGVCAMSDGELISGDNWQATVRRELPPRPNIVMAATETRHANIERIRKRIAPVPEVATPRTAVAATELVKAMHGRVAAAQEGADQARVPVSSRERGTLLHAFLERWDFRSDPQSAIESVLRRESLSDDAAREITHYIARVVALLGQSEIGRRIADATRVERELPFLLRIDAYLVRGTLDVLVDGATIVDYKTGVPSENELALYEAQLQLYAAALRELTGTQPEKALLALVDVEGDIVRAVDVSPPAIDRVLESARKTLPALSASCAPG
ncbi:MAG: UvrD-helicase domain-containing protein [Candidatus Hydrogenedentes bacterium]|nr:UvrD-helicase domain-containing protein [Candidatus Hydrogenedentota bacterium]